MAAKNAVHWKVRNQQLSPPRPDVRHLPWDVPTRDGRRRRKDAVPVYRGGRHLRRERTAAQTRGSNFGEPITANMRNANFAGGYR